MPADDLPLAVYQRGDRSTSLHGSWYRGETCNFIPSKADLAEPDPIGRFIMPGWIPAAPFVGRKMLITAFGSCFAQHVSNYLAARGYNIAGHGLDLNAHIIRFGEGMVNTFAIRQQFEWAFGEREFPDYLWIGPNKEVASVDPAIREETLRIFNGTEVFIITLGLSEIWYDKATGEAFWRAIPQAIFDPEKHGFRVSTVPENLENLRTIHRLIRQARPTAPIIVTLSPIPLMATFRPVSCLTANSVSKAVLRVAIDEFVRSADDKRLHYFPSYEIVGEIYGNARDDDNRHVKMEVVHSVMQTFERYYCIP